MSLDLVKRVAWAIATIKDDRDLDKGITDVDLGKILGTNKDTLAGYRSGRGLLKGVVLERLVSRYGFSPAWLFQGVGEPFPGARAKYPEVCGPEHLPTVNNTDVLALPHAENPPQINIDEAMGKAYKVLQSGTPYAVALYLNIQQFAGALDATKELTTCQIRIDGLEQQVGELRRQVDRLTAPPSSAAQAAAS